MSIVSIDSCNFFGVQPRGIAYAGLYDPVATVREQHRVHESVVALVLIAAAAAPPVITIPTVPWGHAQAHLDRARMHEE